MDNENVSFLCAEDEKRNEESEKIITYLTEGSVFTCTLEKNNYHKNCNNNIGGRIHKL